MLPGILCRQNHTVNAPLAEAAGDNDTVQSAQNIRRVCLSDGLRIDPLNRDLRTQCVAGVAQCLRHREVGIVKLDIFSHKTDGYVLVRTLDALHHLLPFRQLRRRGLQPQLPTDHRGKLDFSQHQRRFVQARQRDIFNDAVGLYVAEQGDLLENRGLQRLIAAQHDEDWG